MLQNYTIVHNHTNYFDELPTKEDKNAQTATIIGSAPK